LTVPLTPYFSVVVPSLGSEARLGPFLTALADQTISPDRREVIVVLDGAAGSPALEARLTGLGGELVRLPRRSGPGAARNAGAARARGAYLAFTEDDVLPAPDWLERAHARLAADPAIDVLEGTTQKPGGRPARVGPRDVPLYLPTNLFVRRELFARLGGYHEGYFDARRGVYVREDSDLGFTLEEAGARIAREPEARVTHPEEHRGYWDPIRWARRYEMDPLLEARHPRLFRERIEVREAGPFRVRRPIVRACVVYVGASAGALYAWLVNAPDVALALLVLAVVALLPVWAKWRFHPLRLPAIALVPFVLVAAYLRGFRRLRRAA